MRGDEGEGRFNLPIRLTLPPAEKFKSNKNKNFSGFLPNVCILSAYIVGAEHKLTAIWRHKSTKICGMSLIH